MNPIPAKLDYLLPVPSKQSRPQSWYNHRRLVILLIVICYGNLTWGYVFLLCRWQVFVLCGSVLVYWAIASACQKRCGWLVILQHLCKFPSLPICHWCQPISLEGHFSEMRKNWCTEVVSPEVIVCVVVMFNSIDLMYPAISGALRTFLFRQATEMWPIFWQKLQVTSWSDDNLMSACRHIENMVFRFFLDWNFLCPLCECSGVIAGCFAVNIFVNTLHRQGCLVWSKFNFFPR